jgi:ABC-type multidrug transport system permease subunit
LYLDAAGGMIARDWLLFTSYRAQLVSMFLNVFTGLALFYFLSRLIRVSSLGTSDQYFAYVVVGMVILEVLQSTFGVSATLRGELLSGTFERLILSPFGAIAAMIATMVFPFISSLIMSGVLLAVATLVFGVPIHWATAPWAIPIALLGTAAFAAFGMLMTAATLVFKRAISGVGLLVTLITLTSGIYFPIALLPHWIQWFSHVQPFTPSVELLRHALVNTPMHDPVWVGVAKLAGFGVVMLPLSYAALRIGLRIGQRRGTIIEY